MISIKFPEHLDQELFSIYCDFDNNVRTKYRGYRWYIYEYIVSQIGTTDFHLEGNIIVGFTLKLYNDDDATSFILKCGK